MPKLDAKEHSLDLLELLGNEIRYKKEYVRNDIYRLYLKKTDIELLEKYLTELECTKNYKKVLEIIEEYQVDVWLLKQCDYENYIRIRKEAMISVGQIIDENGTVFEDEITEEEFNKLQEYFDNENNK